VVRRHEGQLVPFGVVKEDRSGFDPHEPARLHGQPVEQEAAIPADLDLALLDGECRAQRARSGR
jgi:hypothetical protein